MDLRRRIVAIVASRIEAFGPNRDLAMEDGRSLVDGVESDNEPAAPIEVELLEGVCQALMEGGRFTPEFLSRLVAGFDGRAETQRVFPAAKDHADSIVAIWYRFCLTIGKLGFRTDEFTDTLMELASDMLRLSVQLGEAFARSESRIAFAQHGVDTGRHEYLRELLAGRCNRNDSHASAAALGLRSDSTYAVAIARASRGDLLQLEEELRDTVRRAMEILDIHGRNALIEPHAGTLVCVVPIVGDHTGRVVGQALQSAAEQRASRLSFALGSIEPGLQGISVSYLNAVQVLGVLEFWPDRVLTYEEAVPAILLSRSPDLAEEIVTRTVAPLERHDALHNSQLVRVTEGYLAAGCSLATAARRLFVHRHTLSMRLRKVEQLTGLDLTRDSDVLMLQLGLHGRKVLAARGSGVSTAAVGPGPTVQ